VHSYLTRETTTANSDMRRRSPFGCHVAVGDVAPEKVMGGRGRRSRSFHDWGGRTMVRVIAIMVSKEGGKGSRKGYIPLSKCK
jgi:hypothetical protein